jgi:hypothetical protein
MLSICKREKNRIIVPSNDIHQKEVLHGDFSHCQRVNFRHKNNVLFVLLKIDFRKVFDTVSSEFIPVTGTLLEFIASVTPTLPVIVLVRNETLQFTDDTLLILDAHPITLKTIIQINKDKIRGGRIRFNLRNPFDPSGFKFDPI